jgi:hypothetical protein
MWHWHAQDIVGISAAQREDHIAADGGCPVLGGKNRPADEFDDQVGATKQPLGRQGRLSAAKLPASAGISPFVDDPKRP